MLPLKKYQKDTYKLKELCDALKHAESFNNETWHENMINGNMKYLPLDTWLTILRYWIVEESKKLL